MAGTTQPSTHGDHGRAGHRTDRLGRARLTRSRVLAAAVDLADREGLAALSMRKLGAALGVEAMAIYRHAPSKDALLDGMVEVLFTEIDHDLDAALATERAAGMDWREQLHQTVREFHRVAFAHPQVFPLVATRPLAAPLARRPPAMLRVTERLLDLLGRAGFDDRTALAIYRAFVGWLLGYLLMELREVVDDPDEPEPALRLGLHRLPARQYPRLRALAPAFTDHDAHQELAAGLDALLDRLQSTRGGARTTPMRTTSAGDS